MGANQHGLFAGRETLNRCQIRRGVDLARSAPRPQAASRGATLALHLQQTIHRHHVVIQVGHDDHRSEHDKTHDEDAKG
jgi:hypothetical protein